MLANFFTTDPVKNLTITRGNGTDTTSQVNIADPDATDGYIIRAKLTADISADFSVNIWSDASTLCTSAHRCLLTTTDQAIYVNATDSATIEPNGDTIDFNIRINSDTGAAIDTYNATIEYTKTRASFMHNFSSSKCSSLDIYPNTGSELDLIDYRDAKTYKIRRLADQNCWMVDNLAISGTALNPLILDSTTTDMGSGTYSLGEMPTPNGQSYCNLLNVADYPHKCGNYYLKQGVATLGWNFPSQQPAPNSICPKNWRLPATGEFATLATQLGWSAGNGIGNTINDSAWRGLYAGYYTSGGAASNVGTYGYYITSAYSGNALVYNNGTSFSATTNVGSSDSVPIRCVAR
jgi:uncharacterized protein (TIGR02145 family)